MATAANTPISPPQNLLTTIYKQSWHPVVSTQGHITTKQRRTKDGHLASESVKQRETPFQSRPSYAKLTKSSLQKRRSAPAFKSRNWKNVAVDKSMCNGVNRRRYTSLSSWNSPSQFTANVADSVTSYTEMPATMFNNTALYRNHLTNNCVPSSLSSWKRRLKLCVTSHPHTESVKSCCDEPASLASALTRSKESANILDFSRPLSTSSNATLYRLFDYSNPALASICVEGTNVLSYQRSENERKISECTDDSLQDILAAFDVRDDDTKQPTPSCSISDSASDKCSEGDKNLSQASLEARMLELEDDSSENSYAESSTFGKPALNCEVVSSQVRRNHRDWCCGLNNENAPDLNFTNLAYTGDDKIRSSALFEDSDISENELSSDGEDDDIHILGENEESNRICVERCKQLYERENHAAKDNFIRKDTKHNAEYEDDYDLAFQHQAEKYQFADILPKKVFKYDFGELSRLPYDVNWRRVVNLSMVCSVSVSRKPSKRRQAINSCKAQREKILEERKNVEALIDRILVLERLAASTEQREIAIKYHRSHIRSLALKQKSSSNRCNSTSSTLPTETKICDPPPSGTPTSRDTPRRRSSTATSNSRLAWVNELAQGDNNAFEQACKNGDLTLLHENWLANIRQKNRPHSGARRNSDAAKSNDQSGLCKRTKRQRRRSTISHFYEYSSSERTKDEKYRIKSSTIRVQQTCATCREKAKKLHQSSWTVSTPAPLRRPSTANSSMSLSSQRQRPSKTRGRQLVTSKSEIFSKQKTLAHDRDWKICDENLPVQINALKFTEEDYKTIARRPEKNSSYQLKKLIRNEFPQYLSSAVKISSVAFNDRSVLNK